MHDGTSKVRSGVAAAVEEMKTLRLDPDKKGAHVLAASNKIASEGRPARAFNDFRQTVEDDGGNPSPITINLMAYWVTQRVTGTPFRDPVSVKYAFKQLSDLYTYAETNGTDIPVWHPKQIRRFKRHLAVTYPDAPVERAPVFSEEDLAAIHTHGEKSITALELDPHHPYHLHVLQMFCCILIMIRGCLRCGEIILDHLRVCDIEIVDPRDGHEGAVLIHKHYSKTNKTCVKEQTTIALDTPYNAPLVPHFKRYAKLMGFDLGDRKDKRPLFPRMKKGGGLARDKTTGRMGGYTYNQWISTFRAYLTNAGIKDAKRFSGHSCRRTGWTGYANHGMSTETGKRALGWGSDVIMVYREEDHRRIIREAYEELRRHMRKEGLKRVKRC